MRNNILPPYRRSAIFLAPDVGLGRVSTVVIGAGHVLISCLRLVAFMYNRQQKWLMEQRLPDLTFLRRVLRLGPQRVGKHVAHLGMLLSNAHDYKHPLARYGIQAHDKTSRYTVKHASPSRNHE